MPKPTIVLLLDEIERILPTSLGKEGGIAGFFDFFSYLRGVAQETEDFVIVVTGANPALVEVAQFGQRDNPVFNFFQEIYLQLLEPDEVKTMTRRLGRGMGIRFTDAACAQVYELTGGHPYFAREFCSYLARQYPSRPIQIGVGDISAVVDAYLENAGKDFLEIMERLRRDYPAERDVCVLLARASAPVALEDVVNTPRNERIGIGHLIGYQLVRVEGGKVSLTMDLLKRWILAWT